MKIIHGDCLEELKQLPDSSVDAVITDPPYGLSNTKPAQVSEILGRWVNGDVSHVPEKRGGFMGKDWDSFVPPPAVWQECMRVLKPGGHMAVFAGARTQDLMGLSIRLAGFEIRDTLGWIYGSGFPKSMDVSKAIDKAAGAEREVVGVRTTGIGTGKGGTAFIGDSDNRDITAPATPEAKRWDGWGTALKPAIEPIILARKPLVGTVAQNVLEHGVGGLNIDACRVGTDIRPKGASTGEVVSENGSMAGPNTGRMVVGTVTGRFPANVLLDEHAAEEMDKQSGWSKPKPERTGRKGGCKDNGTITGYGSGDDIGTWPADPGGGASRFFPVFKSEQEPPATKGRFPANVLLDEHAAEEMDKQSGTLKSGGGNKAPRKSSWFTSNSSSITDSREPDGGGASRFFPVFKYQAKAPKRERPVIIHEDGAKVQHPTVKPLALMEWLVTLITPEGGTVLDPFAGTGTTLQAATNKGFNPIGIEADTDYIQLIHQRMEGGTTSTRNS